MLLVLSLSGLRFKTINLKKKNIFLLKLKSVQVVRMLLYYLQHWCRPFCLLTSFSHLLAVAEKNYGTVGSKYIICDKEIWQIAIAWKGNNHSLKFY